MRRSATNTEPPATDLARAAKRESFLVGGVDDVYVWDGPHAAGTTAEVHMHAGLEVGILMSGQLERYFDRFSFLALPGDVWLCGIWEPHAWRCTTEETTSVAVHLLPSFLGQEDLGGIPWFSLFAAPPSYRARVSDARTREAVLAIGHEVEREHRERPAGWLTMARFDVMRLLLLISRGWPSQVRGAAASRVKRADLARLTPALELLHDGLAEPLSLCEAARACALSRAQFALIFRRCLGVSFGGYRQRAQVAMAAHLLRTRDHSIAAVADMTGFANASHLHRAFAKHYHITPGQYRGAVLPDDEGLAVLR